MRSPLAACRVELYRARCRPATWGVLALPALVAALRILWARGDAAAANGFGALGDGLLAGGTVLTFLVLALGATQLVRDLDSGSLPYALILQTRSACLLGKSLALAVMVLLAFGMLVGAAIGTAAALFDLVAVVEDGFEMATASELWQELAWTLAASVPSYLAVALLGLLLSVVAPSSAAAVGSALVLAILYDFGQPALGEVSAWIVLTYTPSLGRGAPLDALPKLLRAFSDASFENGELRRAVWVGCGQAAGLLGLALAGMQFRRVAR